MFEFLDREFLLSKVQALSRDMYYTKVPTAYKIAYLLPKQTPFEQLFINIVRNMDTKTHKYKSRVPYNLMEVSLELQTLFKIFVPNEL